MNNQPLNFPTSHGRHIEESDSRPHPSLGSGSDGKPIRYASLASQITGEAPPIQHFQSNDANPVPLYPGYMWDPQYSGQHGNWNDYAALGMSHPGYLFSNQASDSGFVGPAYGGLQPGFNVSESGSQYLSQHGQWNDDAAFDMSQPGYHFPNAALDSGCTAPLYQELQPRANLWENSPGTISFGPPNTVQYPFSDWSGMLHMNGTQLAPAVPSTITVPAHGDGVTPTANNDSNRCNICNRTFGRPQELRRHMGKHQSPKYKCAFFDCNKTFYRRDKWCDHLKQGHRGTNLLQ